ncbi:hypothetical protein C8R45DRAFT_1138267 [Mycena sanguinolenta]|nr:hypothetical protein C8R45DRAFT_1138267 [Mycena sanguinolenta]
MLSSIHRNPTARVYTLRCLLGTTLPVIVLSVNSVVIPGVVWGIVIWIHHILVIFNWTLRGLALIDLAAVVIEICALGYMALFTGPLGIPPLAFLLLSLLFRITTIVKTNERLVIQRKTTIHSDVHPPQPIAGKAIVVSTTLISNPSFEEDLPGNATITFAPDDYHYDSTTWEVSVTAVSWDHSGIDCPIDGPDISSTAICKSVEGILTLFNIGELTTAIGVEVGVLRPKIGCTSGVCVDVVGIPLLRGSRLFGMLAWSQTTTLRQAGAMSSLIYSPEFYGLQSDNLTTNDTNITALRLSQVSTIPVKFFRDTADASFLSGIATFGGFWTFVNGAFALFFGANVIYFAFGRRPLSALGVVHLFQRRTLVQSWYEDFPAIQTEGGLPGSENAGIVAFIRERLVDLGDHPQDIEPSPRASGLRPVSRAIWADTQSAAPQLSVEPPGHRRRHSR